MVFPKLIDNNTSFYLQNTLHKCHETRVNLYYYIINISVLVIFGIVTGIILYNCYNNKLTGDIPLLENSPDLEYIDCSNNQLNGSILLENKDNLRVFYCQNNQLSGTIKFRIGANFQEFNCTNNNG